MTDITELAQSLKAAAEKYKSVWGIARYSKAVEAREKFHELVTAANVIALVEALEKAQQERENWRTSFDNERFRADKLKAYIDDMEPIRAAAEKLVRCKGRYHSEQNYRALAALFGVTTPDLPPLEHENVHYADAAEMEIAALRQCIAELESRTATVAAADVLAERKRQVSAEGWTPGHDDEYEHGELADAAGCYALSSELFDCAGEPPRPWPWPDEWWKPTNRRRDLVKAGALILAEIERLDRAAGIKVEAE
ncbi:ead/Ea22-like family protein [Klebsiella pneumoniae]|uniref:ead/Ea22-like family protein n=1 Tax=Klebsiella pneumoniae TaxID=573 RepID=UPI000E2C1E1D|nr:ead/Ea22-like family protein [Klebsiella pneumoniae]WKH87361.1 ead/Ea22-like family protein [Klebsiella pneumoniae]SVV23174.1 Ead domain protein [Klebsiella pneumoniae]VGD14739.1 Ead domain protein [Klebsiella pneumoniae]